MYDWEHHIRLVLSPDLLSAQWKKLVKPCDHRTAGHCYAASEAAYHLFAKKKGYKPAVINLGEGKTHWFLRHPSGGVIDVTRFQFDYPVKYSKGKNCGWLTGDKPSRRCKEIMHRVLDKTL